MIWPTYFRQDLADWKGFLFKTRLSASSEANGKYECMGWVEGGDAKYYVWQHGEKRVLDIHTPLPKGSGKTIWQCKQNCGSAPGDKIVEKGIQLVFVHQEFAQLSISSHLIPANTLG